MSETSAPMAAFFDQLGALLQGRTSADDVEAALGPVATGTDALAFYRTMVLRQWFLIMRDLYEPIRLLAQRREPGLWTRLVQTYAAAHPPAHFDPNQFGEGFGDFLARQRAVHGTIPTLWEELADYCWIRHRANVCPDDVGDGFEQRLFVRQYTHDVVAVAKRLSEDPAAELPGAKTIVVLVYRHARALDVRLFFPNAAGLAALAVREGTALPAAFATIPQSDQDAAIVSLVEHGVLLAEEELDR